MSTLSLCTCCVPVSVATVNEYALKGLDKMEEKLPILHQPADKVRQKMILLYSDTL